MERSAPEAWRIAVLTSGHGRGSNLRALHLYFTELSLPVKIAFVTAARASAPIAGLCGDLGLPCHILSPRRSVEFEARLLELCRSQRLQLIALAGFLSRLSEEFLQAVGIPVLNIHPALLPRFGGEGMYGLRVHEAVFAAGERISGASIHLVDPLYDHGKIIAQQEVDISACRSPQEIADKVLRVEHQIYGPAVYSFLRSRMRGDS